jgi:hypothetical protein
VVKTELGPTCEQTKKAATPKRVPMARRGYGAKGQRIQLLTNHFKVAVPKSNDHFYQYSVFFFTCNLFSPFVSYILSKMILYIYIHIYMFNVVLGCSIL